MAQAAEARNLLTVLMPVSVLGFGLGLHLHGVATADFAAAFYWLWALKNWLAGPLKGDAGIVTFALFLAGRGLNWEPRTRAACAMLIAANYALPLALLGAMRVPATKVARKLKKSEGWVAIFQGYLAMGASFWTFVAVAHWSRPR